MLKIIVKSGLLLVITTSVFALEYVPEVYKDDYVVVRSGVMESGSQPINLGDQLNLTVEIDFRTDEVLVESLTEDIFRRNWGSEKGLVMNNPPDVTVTNVNSEITTLRAVYPFEILDCPGDMSSCPGNKIYTLPVITLGYQILDNSGAVVNNKSIRFNSWPGSLAVTPVLPVHHDELGEFASYFPDGAYTGSVAYTDTYTGGLWTALFGGLLVLTSFAPALFTSPAPRRAEVTRNSGKRWENVLALLQDNPDRFTDEEWSDLIRRSAVWYCMDEYAFNPYTWMNDPSSGNTQALQTFRPYFIDVMNEEGIDKARRSGYVSRFRQLAGLSGTSQ
jgi:hypothetical protein